MSASPQPEFSFSVDVTSLPPLGRHYEIKADESERARVAERLDLVGIASLTAAFDLTPSAGGIVTVTGRVDAEVTQTCVVTLVPVPAVVKETVEARFVLAPLRPPPKAAGKSAGGKADKEAEEVVDFSAEEPPEEALDGHIDLGELAVVQLALGLNPYPRAPGAAFKAPSWVEKDEKSDVVSPFAVLANLKKKSPS